MIIILIVLIIIFTVLLLKFQISESWPPTKLWIDIGQRKPPGKWKVLASISVFAAI